MRIDGTLLKIIIAFLLLIGIVVSYLYPYTQFQIFKATDSYFSFVQDKKAESLDLITTKEQYFRDMDFIDKVIVNKFQNKFAFTNRNIRIIENTTTTATVEVSTVISVEVNGKIQTEPILYKLDLVRARNSIGDKTWIITNRTP